MELKTSILKYQRLAARQTCMREESIDGIVPDSQPDIARIIDISVMIFVKDREPGQDSINLRCSAKAEVIYAADDDNLLYRMEVPLSFNHRCELKGAAVGDNILTKSWIQAADARIINTRKITVRINAAFENLLYKNTTETITEGVNNDTGWCEKTGELAFSRIKAVSFKNFTLAEDISLDEDSKITNILSSDISFKTNEIKLALNRVMVKADAMYTGLCSTEDGTYCRILKAFSFNQSCDIPGVEENDICRIDFELRNFEVIPSVDVTGSSRYLSINAGITMNIEARDKVNVTVLEDIYGLYNECSYEKDTLYYRPFSEDTYNVSKFETQIENSDALSILYARYKPDKGVEKSDDEIIVSGTVNYIYTNSDGEICGAQLRTRDKINSTGKNMRIEVDADPVSWQIHDGLIKFCYAVGINENSDAVISREFLKKVSEGEPYKQDRYSGLSAILRRAAAGDKLWDIARTYHTKVTAITEVNNLSDDVMPSDRLLLIPIEHS